jgi:hypothetical protein
VGITAQVPGAEEEEGGSGDVEEVPDTGAPRILNLMVTRITETTARVIWDTDDVASATLSYGTAPEANDELFIDPRLMWEHTFDLSGLTLGTTYYVLVTSSDDDGNTDTEETTFTTLDLTAPRIEAPQVTDVSETSALVIWTTDEEATTIVRYGLTTSYELGVLTDSDSVTDHMIPLDGLEPGTTYHVQARSVDASGNEAVSEDLVFTTLVDYPPTNVMLTVTPGVGTNRLVWELPPDEDVVGVRVVYRTDRFPTDPFDGYLIFNELGEEYLHVGLTAGVEYFYAVFVYDAQGNFSSGTLGSGIVLGGAEEPEGTKEAEEAEVPEVPRVTEEQPPVIPSEGPAEQAEAEARPDEPVGRGSPAVDESDIQIYVEGGLIMMEEVAEDTYRFLADTVFVPSVSVDGEEEIQSIVFEIDGQSYLMSAETTATLDKSGALVEPVTGEVSGNIAFVELPEEPGSYPFSITVTYADGSTQTFDYTAEIVPLGSVLEQVEGRSELLPEALVWLFVNVSGSWVQWDASLFGQENPIAPSAGLYGWYVPNGTYKVRVTAPGYYVAESGTITVTDHIVNEAVEMQKIPPPLVEVITAPTPLPEKVPAVVEGVAVRLGRIGWVGLAVPFLALALVGFWQLMGLGCVKGKVFLSNNRAVVPHAEVLLYKVAKDGEELVAKTVTDEHGRYRLRAKKTGVYTMKVIAPLDRFPSTRLLTKSDEGKFHHLFHGKTFRVFKWRKGISTDIPLDPESG